jgi:hypothetical protein
MAQTPTAIAYPSDGAMARGNPRTRTKLFLASAASGPTLIGNRVLEGATTCSTDTTMIVTRVACCPSACNSQPPAAVPADSDPARTMTRKIARQPNHPTSKAHFSASTHTVCGQRGSDRSLGPFRSAHLPQIISKPRLDRGLFLRDLTANFAAFIISRMNIDIPFAACQITRLCISQCG